MCWVKLTSTVLRTMELQYNPEVFTHSQFEIDPCLWTKLILSPKNISSANITSDKSVILNFKKKKNK